MARRPDHTSHECGPECKYRGLYEGSQRSLADLASRQADALGRITRLRTQIVQGLKRIMPVEFTEAERALGRRLSEVDDELLSAYLESFLLLASGKTRSEASMVARLRTALESAGVDLYGAHSLSEIVAVLEKNAGSDQLQGLFGEVAPAQRGSGTNSGVHVGAVERESAEAAPSPPASTTPQGNPPLRRLLPRTSESDQVATQASRAPAPNTPAPSTPAPTTATSATFDRPATFTPPAPAVRDVSSEDRAGGLDDLFDGDFVGPPKKPAPPERPVPPVIVPLPGDDGEFDLGDSPEMPPEEPDFIERVVRTDEPHIPVESAAAEPAGNADAAQSSEPVSAPKPKKASGRGAPLRGPWAEGDEVPTSGAEVTTRAVSTAGGIRPALLPTSPRTRQRKTKTATRTSATPADGLDVPVDQIESSGELDDAMRERLMNAICMPRPVFSADLVDLVKSPEVVADWENELADNGRDLSVIFVLPKTRHKIRGTLIFPREWPSTAPAAVRNSLWARVAEKYRGAKVYELGVLLHRFNEEVISSDLGNHVVTLRLNRPQGLVGVVVVLSTALGEGEGTRAELVDALETLQHERLVQIAVLSTNAEVVDTLAEVVAEEAERREWAPTMPVTLSRSWEYANGTGVALPLLGA